MKTVLILGATGSVGANITRNLARRGWNIRALHRNPQAAAEQFKDLPDIDWRRGDMHQPGDATAAAQGCDVIVNATNPPGYRHWREIGLPMHKEAIAAAKANGATLVFPANVYNYAPDSGENIAETAAQQPVTEKGRVRVEMEQMLREAADEGVQVILVRAGDFFGPGADSSVLNLLIKPGRRITKMAYFGPMNVKHAYAYLPDLAETFARLIERREQLPNYADFQFAGQVISGAELAQQVRNVSGEPAMKAGGFPWWLVHLVAPFNLTFKGLLEMRYLWNKPITLNNAKLVAELGEEPRTPMHQALTQSLDSLGCLPRPQQVQVD
ncbi:NAD-dependent epimerase/dehydratase family protein [Saccharospirillum mangrovi]|uniref:NAD-dependent epimerase/dehydratase family protein n=1 Tax=Saccharospirillum mangrovi TaxID=2161747 RepID=UPI000D3C864A|nr:NAD-dependent epimerase/dehydratase family protein [Saccharospirillum mangrovi]